MQTVAHEATDEKVVRFAKRKIKSSPGEHATRYVPGSISIADEARKYPPLHPQLTSAAVK